MPLPPGWRKNNLPAKLVKNVATTNGRETFLGSVASALGLTVSGRDAMAINTVFACVGLLSRIMSSLPVKVYGADKKELANHDLSRVLKFPNGEMTGPDFRAAINANLALHGFAIAVIVRDGAGRVSELRPVPSSQVAMLRDTTTKRLSYKVFNVFTGQQETFDFSRVLHFRSGVSFDGIASMSPELGLENVISIARAIDTFASSFYANGANPSMIIKTVDALTPDQVESLKRQIAERVSTPGNARPIVLGKNMDATTIQGSAQSAQTIEQRKEQDLAICRMFGVPPHKVGIFGDSSSASVEQKAIEFVQSTIGPLCVSQEAVYGALLPRNEQTTVQIKHNLAALLRGDTASQSAHFAVMRQNGVYSANDIRAFLDMPAIDGGDEYLTPLNMVAAGSGATGNPGTQTTRQNKERQMEFSILNRA